jgi:hypothetical protein
VTDGKPSALHVVRDGMTDADSDKPRVADHDKAFSGPTGRGHPAPGPDEAIPDILDGVAKVMVSFPDDLLRAIDLEAERRGTTRSGLLQQLAEETIRQRSRRRAERMAEIDRMHGRLVGHGGNAAEAVKASRPKR